LDQYLGWALNHPIFSAITVLWVLRSFVPENSVWDADRFSQTKTAHFSTLPMNIDFPPMGEKFPAAISQPITAMNRRQAGRWVDRLQNLD
jgi:hypothetical protein